MIPITIIDFRVAVYNLTATYTQIVNLADKQTSDNWLRAAWSIVINRGFTGIPWEPHLCVIVDDRNLGGKYWRHDYLEERGFPEYKGSRNRKEDIWYEVQKVGQDYVNRAGSELYFLGYEGFEADDVAAAIVRLNNENPTRHVYLHTIDSDWCGLVNDNVTWCNMDHWTPRRRDHQGFLNWATKKKFKHPIAVPTDLWVEKSINGDKSDNLPKNSPIEVIDLLHPPIDFDLLQDNLKRDRLVEVHESNFCNVRLDHLKASADWLVRNGLVNPCYQFNLFPLEPQALAA